MTSEDFAEVYFYSGLQALFVTVFQTSVDLLCKKSYKSSSLLGYFDCFLSNHTVRCCNKMAGRHGAPRPPMTDVGTETAFRLEKAQAFPKK